MKFLGGDSELQNTTKVNINEGKLPNDLKTKWIERIYEQNSRADKLNKFPDLLAFLLERKIMLEYNEDKLESTSEANLNAKTCSQTGRSPTVSSNERKNNTFTS